MHELDSHDLGSSIAEQVRKQLAEVEQKCLRGLRLPAVFAGHPVNADAVATLVNALSSLVAVGIDEVAGVDLRQRVVDEIERLDPDSTSGFASMFIAESVQRLGLSAVSDLERLVRLVRTSATLDQVRSGDLPPNWTVVATRCLHAEAELTGEAPPALAECLDRTATLLEGGRHGWVNDGIGDGAHYDIYTPDLYLLSEVLAPELGPVWADGLRSVLADLDLLAQPGGAVVWGRSIGVLGLALTPELAGLAARHQLSDNTGRWLERARQAVAGLQRWFPDGLVAADQHRTSDFYRGPSSRLSLTFDVEAKLLRAASALLSTPAERLARVSEAWPSVNHWVAMEEGSTAGVWGVRSPRHQLSFALPIQYGWTTDYLPSPRSPGLFESPTNGHPCYLPTIDVGQGSTQRRLVPRGLAAVLHSDDTKATIGHDGWGPPTQASDEGQEVRGSRQAVYRILGATLAVEERLGIEDIDHVSALSLLIPETAGRPLDVSVSGEGASVTVIGTDGLPDWRSVWSAIPRVHQIDVPVAETIEFAWQVTPQLRVGSTIHGVAYDQLLYGPLADKVRAGSAPLARSETLGEELFDLDVLHLGWPEWWSGTDPSTTERIIHAVKEAGVTVVWTQHNLLPHNTPREGAESEAARACYQLWAEAVDGVIHHTKWGENLMRSTYNFAPDAQHMVIPHGHWGPLYDESSATTLRPVGRSAVERALGWEPCSIRLAVFGAARAERDVQLVLDAFHACRRDDLQLIVRVEGDEVVPEDPRIVVERGPADAATFFWRNRAVDACILPVTRLGMLTTGTAFDAIGAPMAPITSNWGFFDETFEGLDIRFGSTVDDLRDCLDDLSVDQVVTCKTAIEGLRPRHDWDRIAAKTLEFLESATPGRSRSRLDKREEN